jgi:hypothetical protein
MDMVEVVIKKKCQQPGAVAYVCYPRYLGGRDRKITF